jgi:adenylate kinase family enzyme
MRVSVIGTSGSGKTTMARRLGEALDLPTIELDAINWQAGWRDLNTFDPETFVRRVEEALAADRWVTDGNYSRVRPLVMARATHVVWLDYPKAVVMARVLRRSVMRSLTRAELWPGTGNVEDWRRWLDPDHPIRWAWDTFSARRARYEAMLEDPTHAHLQVLRLRSPKQAEPAIQRLARAAARG